VANVTAGVDLGGTKIQVVLLRDQEVVGQHRVPTPQTGASDVIAAIVGTAEQAASDAGIDRADITAVGIGTPGVVDGTTGTVSLAANLVGFTEPVELGPLVSSALGGPPVKVDNDVRVAILGEFERGAGRPYRNLLGVWAGTGVGGGFVLDGQLRHGRGAAGEIGHTVVKRNGRRCNCGRLGCLEAYAGRRSIEAEARRLHEDGKKTVLFEIMEKRGRDRMTSGVIARALDDGDKMAKRLVDDAVWALGVAIANAQNMLDLEAVIVGGGLGDRLGQPFVDRIGAEMETHLFNRESPPALLTTGFGDLSGAVGAAVVAGG
jgi:glucokinase